MARALELVRGFAADARLDTEAVERLAIVVEEWISNLIEHADLPPGARIGLSLHLDGGAVRIRVTDPGAPFDPRDAVFEGPNPERGGGAGLALLHAWSDVDRYDRRGGRNHLRLTLSVRPTAADVPADVG